MRVGLRSPGFRAAGTRVGWCDVQAWLPRFFIVCLLLAALPAAPRAQTVGDPLETLNRGIFEFNRIVDGLVLKPASELYDIGVPDPAKRGVSNFLDNLRAPVVFLNLLLQGEREQAGIAIGRFMINTMMGGFGLFDVATGVGIEPRQDADFGQTLGRWGVGGGAYLVLPIFGPSTLRDAGGIFVDGFLFDPSMYVTEQSVQLARRGVSAVDARYRYGPLLDDLEAGSLDFYVAARSAYLQNRAARIRKDSDAPDEAYESIFDDDFDDLDE